MHSFASSRYTGPLSRAIYKSSNCDGSAGGLMREKLAKMLSYWENSAKERSKQETWWRWEGLKWVWIRRVGWIISTDHNWMRFTVATFTICSSYFQSGSNEDAHEQPIRHFSVAGGRDKTKYVLHTKDWTSIAGRLDPRARHPSTHERSKPL